MSVWAAGCACRSPRGLAYHRATVIKVVTDSTCDLTDAAARALGITVVPMFVEIDGVMHQDGVTLTREAFYTGLPGFRAFPKTAAGSPGMFADAYRAAARDGATDILSIHIARHMSGVCAAADVAARDVAAEGIRVRVFDSETMSVGLGLLAQTAARLANAGAGVPDILAALEAQRARTLTFALADTLKYLRKGGRVSAIVAGIGELLHLRLLVEFKAGRVEQLDRQRTRRGAIDKLVDAARAAARPNPRYLGVMYTGGEGVMADVQAVRSRLSDVLPEEQHIVAEVTPVIGAHFGPLALAVVVVNA